MRHAHDDFPGAVARGPGDNGIEQGNQAFRPFERKTLLSHITRVDEFLQGLRIGQPLEQTQFLRPSPIELPNRPLDLLLYPAFAGHIADMHVLHAKRAAIHRLERIDDPTQLGALRPDQRAGIKLARHVRRRQAVVHGIELRNLAAWESAAADPGRRAERPGSDAH